MENFAALACGNTVVLKPAETAPLTALKLAELLRDIDLPRGVVNIVTRRDRAALVGHPASTRSPSPGPPRGAARSSAGWPALRSATRSNWAASPPTSSSRMRRFDQAVEELVDGIFFNQGHVCCAGSRLLVQESVAAE